MFEQYRLNWMHGQSVCEKAYMPIMNKSSFVSIQKNPNNLIWLLYVVSVFTHRSVTAHADDASILRHGSEKTSQECTIDEGGAGWL